MHDIFLNILKQVFQHAEGEIWSLMSSPDNPSLLATCYNSLSVPDTGCAVSYTHLDVYKRQVWKN